MREQNATSNIPPSKLRPMKAFPVIFFLLGCAIAFPVPGRGKFSENLLEGFTNASEFAVNAFDIAHSPIAGGCVISASIRGIKGDPPTGVKDTPEIARLPREQLARQDVGLVLLVSGQNATVKWARRIFLLPRGATVRVLSLFSEQIIACATTKNSSSTATYVRGCARFSMAGEVKSSRRYRTPVAMYTAIQTSPTEPILYGLYDSPGGERPAVGKVGFDKLDKETLALNKTMFFTPKQAAAGRVIVKDESFDITVVKEKKQTKVLVQTRETTSDKEGRNFRIQDRVCSTAENGGCFGLRAGGVGTAIPVFEVADDFGYFVQLFGSGGAEYINVTRIDVDTMKPDMSTWGDAPAQFEIPPAEGSGRRPRSHLASVVPLPSIGKDTRVRVLFTTAGTVDENAAVLKPLSRFATVDILPNGAVGTRSLNTHIEETARAAGMLSLPRNGRVDSIVLGTLSSTEVGADARLYLGVVGDPVPPPKASPKLTTQVACIGHSTTLNGERVHTVLRRLENVRIQWHPLRLNRRQRVDMLCFETSANDNVCATELHVMLYNNVPTYMRDICAKRGDCRPSFEYPLNYKAACGTTIRVSAELSLTMHSSSTTAMTAKQAIESECDLQRRSYGMWVLRTL